MDNYNGYFKVEESCGSVSVGKFYNPETKKEFSKIIYDNDDDRLLFDDEIQALRQLPLNEMVRYHWKHEKGIPQKGDMVEVVKGRKVPKGTKGVIVAIHPIYDKYRRWQADYVYFDNGLKTNITNVKLLTK